MIKHSIFIAVINCVPLNSKINMMKAISSIVVLSLLLFFGCNEKKVKSVEVETETTTEIKDSTAYPEWVSLDYVMGKFKPEERADFTKIPEKYADRSGLYMRTEAYDSYLKMYEHALKDGINLQIRSAARNFEYQKGIWERKWTGETKLSDGTDVSKDIQNHTDKALKILEYSSMPGTSRHHWGTDIDLNAFNNKYFESGEGKKVYDWLTTHAASYGYCQPYTPKNQDRPRGYNEEKWHWSFMPLSVPLTKFAEENMQNKFIEGFQGASTAPEIDVVSGYILGISKSCLENHK